MANARGKHVDKTHLSLDLAEERLLIHRDYLAHCLRWSHVVKWAIKHRATGLRVLDVGCGKEVPLARALYVNKIGAEVYVGVDANKLEVPEMLRGKKFPLRLISGDAAKLTKKELGFAPNLVTCFEVAEHMELEHWQAVLKNIHVLLANDGTFIMSTPCFNGSAAGNHVNELTYQACGALLEDAGFTIEAVYGTFASIKDYEEALLSDYGAAAVTMFMKLREYYDTNVLAILWAPLFPEHSRNALWRCRKMVKGDASAFPPLSTVQRPWGSSEIADSATSEDFLHE